MQTETVTRRQALSLLGALGLGAQSTWVQAAPPAVPPEVLSRMASARLQGESRYRFYGFHVYDGQLWVPPGFDPSKPFTQPFALSLIYARELKAKDIAERSIEEMRRQATITEPDAQRWIQAMTAAFADVRAGDRLTGQYVVGGGASFFFNGQFTQTISDARFAALFFGIWLSSATSAPAFRRELLGV